MTQLVVKLLVSVVHPYPKTFDTSTQTIKENAIAHPSNYIKQGRSTPSGRVTAFSPNLGGGVFP